MPTFLDDDAYFERFLNAPLIRAGRKLQQVFYREAIAPTGLSVQQWRTLLIVNRLQEAHMREVARAGFLDATHVSRAVSGLERKGLVQVTPDGEDARRKRVRILPAGNALVDEVWPKAVALDQAMRDKLGAERYATLREALSLILDSEEIEIPDATGPLAAE